MALDFPTSPSPNQVHTSGSRSWTWNNSVGAWYAVNAGVQGVQGIQGTQGIQGVQGITGLAFTIAKTYLSVAALTADTAPTSIVAGQFALINTTNVEDAENSRLYIWNGSSYIFVDDLSGSAGIQGITGSQGTVGAQGTQGIQGITGSQGTVGAQGITGSQGTIGTSVTGAQGTQGISGASILGLNNTFTGVNSININGTVGATTRNTVAATTLDATRGSSGTILNLLSGNSAYYGDISIGRTTQEWFLGLSAANNNYATGTVAGDLVLGASGAANLFFGINNSVVGKFTSTGLAVTGLLSATNGLGLLNGNSINFGGAGSDTYINGSAATDYVEFVTGAAQRALINNTGLTITGGLSATSTISTTGQLITTTAGAALGSMTGGANAYFDWSDGTTTSRLQMSGGVLYFGTAAGGGTFNLRVNSSTIASLTSTGLAVTGALSSTTGATFATSSGDVGIGTSSPGAKLEINSGNSSAVKIRTNGDFEFNMLGTAGSNLQLFSIRNNSSGVVHINTQNSARLALGVSTGSSGSSIAEQMTINSSGTVMIGTTNTDPTYNRVTGMNISSGGRLYTRANGAWDFGSDSSAPIHITFYTDNGSARVSAGQISSSGSTTTYTTSSDYRRKSNIQDVANSGTFIDALKPRTFDWETGDKGVGFLAHEFAEVSPSSVVGEKDAVDADGKPVYQSMQAGTSEVIANLVAELQSVRARLAALESK
jgi:collagen type I/II/III/V/XI/XXIV/XXVII alpha